MAFATAAPRVLVAQGIVPLLRLPARAPLKQTRAAQGRIGGDRIARASLPDELYHWLPTGGFAGNPEQDADTGVLADACHTDPVYQDEY